MSLVDDLRALSRYENSDSSLGDDAANEIESLQAEVEALRKAAVPAGMTLWLWKNFVDGKPEYWAFDNPFPAHMDGGDPQTLGEPCGYAIFKPSRRGRTDVSEGEVLRRIMAALAARPEGEKE